MSSRIEQIIGEIEEYVDSCKFQPLSTTKIVVNKEEIEELLRELRLKTPDEIKRYQKIINKDATDENVMKLSKVVTVIIGIIVICFGVFQPGSIFEINLFAFSGMAIFVVPILFGIYWKKATAKGAIASVIVGIISLLLFTLNPSVKALAMGFHALFPTTIIASIVMIVVSKFTETPPQETIDRHFTV